MSSITSAPDILLASANRPKLTQFDHILDLVDPSVKKCIIAGDFNTFSKSIRKTTFQSFLKANYKIASESIGWTYKYWYLLNKRAALDHIFIKGMNVIDSGKVTNRKPSDHLPIWGELKLISG